MSTDVKAIILCNNPIAVPGIREFLFYGKAGAIVVTKRNKEMQHIVNAMVQNTGLPVIIVNRKDYTDKLVQAIQQYEINTGLVMTFPYILTEEVWKLPAKGFINFHYGLLPQCRGPQPILRHLLNSDKEAGVTIHKMDAGIDTGEIIMQERIPIDNTDTYGLLQTKLAFLAARQAASLLKILSYGTIIPSVPQDESKAMYYQMPGADELTIKWKQMTAEQIIRLINACNPWNKGAGATINEWTIGITEAELSGECFDRDLEPGTIISCNEQDGLIIKTADSKRIRVNIVYTSEGFFSGGRLAAFGIKPDMCFQ